MRKLFLFALFVVISGYLFAKTQATHPKASRSKPVLPSKITSGWKLNEFAHSSNPVSFIKANGYYAIYTKPCVATVPTDLSTYTLRIDILQNENASEAEAIYTELNKAYQYPETSEKLVIAGLKKLTIKEGILDTPIASSNAKPIKIKCAIAWFPPFIVLFQIQNGTFGIEEIKTIIKSLAWRE